MAALDPDDSAQQFLRGHRRIRLPQPVAARDQQRPALSLDLRYHPVRAKAAVAGCQHDLTRQDRVGGMAILAVITHGRDARATSRGMAVLAMISHGRDARAASRGIAILAMTTHGRDARAASRGMAILAMISHG